MVAAALAGALWAAIVVLTLPAVVNAAAYLAGAGAAGTFTATAYTTDCSYSSTGDMCWTDTEGYLEPTNVETKWAGEVPMGTTFPVRLPAWNWGPGTPLALDTGLAVYTGLICGLIQLLAWGGLGYVAYRKVRSGQLRWR
jgi:hypothetical protein